MFSLTSGIISWKISALTSTNVSKELHIKKSRNIPTVPNLDNKGAKNAL